MNKHIDYNIKGLKCDNENCTWIDNTIEYESYIDWLNKPCPICGQIVLTEEQYNETKHIVEYLNTINSFSEQEINQLNEIILNENKDLKCYKDVLKKFGLIDDLEVNIFYDMYNKKFKY